MHSNPEPAFCCLKIIAINMNKIVSAVILTLFAYGCAPKMNEIRTENRSLPSTYNSSTDTINSANISWKNYFKDPNLALLIDTALINNQELNLVLQEIEISKNEIQVRKGEYLPFLNLRAGAGLEKEGRYTRHGAVDENIEIKPGKEFPEPLTDFLVGTYATWELDIWKKLRNSKKSAVTRYLASVDGKNFMITNLVAEIANLYFELMALDNLLDIVNSNIGIQENVFQIIKQQKDAAKATQLAVNRFEAQVLHTKNLQYEIRQKIVESENRINFLVGRFPQPVKRSANDFMEVTIDSVYVGIPIQLLSNRPDIRQAELEVAASKLDVSVAKANFYPSIKLDAGVGIQAFNPVLLVSPQSILFSLAGDMVAPLINKNAIIAIYKNASSKQLQAIFNYERAILSANVEVANLIAKLENYKLSLETKSQEVTLLNESISISNRLFNSARADYMEVLLTQREALESRVELIEIKLKQINAQVDIYRALGGGWN